MKYSPFAVASVLAALLCVGELQASERQSAALTETIAELDRAVFDSFNRCAEPGQLEKHAGYFAEDVEFYHDNGGVTWNRADMLANTRQHVCGKFTRELIRGSLVVYPIKDFGAISVGSH